MTGLIVIILITCGVFIIVLWNKVTRQEEEIKTLKNDVLYISNYLQGNIAPQTNKNTNGFVSPASDSHYTQTVAETTYKEPQQDQVKYSYVSVAPVKKDIYVSKPKLEPELAPKDKPKTLENWLGKNVFGIAASVLVFIGLIFLGTLVYKQITEDMKIFAMYVISAIATGIGIYLTIKKRNHFTEVLVGCGCGSFYISILLTHIYFNKINDIVAFSLLLVWMVAILYLSKVFNSTLFSIVAHIGMIISICFAFGLGLTDEKLLLLLIYQVASIAVILLGNVICCKKTYHFGVFVSLLLTIIASCFMWSRFCANEYQAGSFPFATTLPIIEIAVAFAAQFLCASFLSYLLSVSTNRLQDELYRMLLHVANKAMWLTALIINMYLITYRIAAGLTAHSALAMTAGCQLIAVFAAVMICIAIILVHAALTLFMSLKLNFNSKLETYSVLFLSAAASVFMMILWGFQFGVITVFPRISYLLIISLLLLLAKHISRNKAYAVGAYAIMAIDALFMLFDGYRNLTSFGTISLSIGYMLIYVGIISVQWLRQNKDGKARYSKSVRLASFLIVNISLISIFASSQLKYHTAILMLVLTVLNILLYFFHYDRNTEKYSDLRTVMFINQLAILAFDAISIAFASKDATTTILYLLLSALAFVFSFIRINEVFDGNASNAVGILTGIKLTVLVIATVYGITSWFNQAYFFSIVCMLTALICIILGFAWSAKSLRLYGLVMTLVCVLKLVTYDVTNLNTLLRVVALIGGGIICFIISAIYNYTTKKIYHEKSTV